MTNIKHLTGRQSKVNYHQTADWRYRHRKNLAIKMEMGNVARQTEQRRDYQNDIEEYEKEGEADTEEKMEK